MRQNKGGPIEKYVLLLNGRKCWRNVAGMAQTHGGRQKMEPIILYQLAE